MTVEVPLALLIGESPHAHGDRPLAGRPARVLCDVGALDHQRADVQRVIDGYAGSIYTAALHRSYHCLNLHADPVDRWSLPVARAAATAILDLHLPTVVVCLGRRVQRAMIDALGFRGARLKGTANDGWGGGLFGSFGVWAAPWHIHPVTVHKGCVVCKRKLGFGETELDGPCTRPSGNHWMGDIREREYAPWLVTVPHPSGLNRLLNDPATRDRMRVALKQARDLAAEPNRYEEILKCR